jgi:hypothetical protein
VQDIPPNVIAVAPEPDEDRGGNGGPDYLQTIVPVAVGSRDPFPGPVFDDKKDVNELGQDKDTAREKKDEPHQLIDVHAALAHVLGHPPKVRGAQLIGPGGRKSGEKYSQDQATTSEKRGPSAHIETGEYSKHGTKILIFVIRTW